jgi:hypothetical protein
MDPNKLLACFSIVLAGCTAMPVERYDPRPLRAVSDTVVKGFVFPESVGCDRAERVLYVSQFGGKELKPAEKDGLGYVSKVALDGKVIEERAFDERMNKPKGIWIAGNRLWVTDIDGVWVFDTQSRKGRKVMIPGAQFANDPAVAGGALYVSDNRSDQLFRIEPADFLNLRGEPSVTTLWSKKDINPNGLWPARDGSIIVVGFAAADKPRGIHAMDRGGELKTVVQPFGRLDGVHQLRDGSLLLTDWNAGSLARWSRNGLEMLAKDFRGPADFCVMGDTVYVPDLVKSELRIIKLGR